MRKLIPCPSPNNTNNERLFLIRRPNLGVMAQDAALPPEPDDNGAPGAYEDLCKFLADNLDPDALGQAQELLSRFVTGNSLGIDEPESFAGQPKVGGTMERNSEVGHFGSNPPQAGRDSRMSFDERLAISAKVRAGRAIAERYLFDKKFPGAARIRSV